MKWLKLAFTILEYILPFVAKKGKNNLEQELEIVKKAVDILSKDKTPQEKGQAIEEAVGNLMQASGFNERLSKKLNKAKARLYKKIF